MTSQTPPSNRGKKRERSGVSDSQEEKDSITKKISISSSTQITTTPQNQTTKKKNPRKRKIDTSSTLESRPPTKKRTYTAKSTSSKKRTPTTKLCQTLDQASTSTDPNLLPFWNKSCQEMSDKLWYTTETDSVDLQENLSNGSSKHLTQKSWFTVKQKKTNYSNRSNSQTTSSQLLTTLWPKVMGDARKTKEEKENNRIKALLKSNDTKKKKAEAVKAKLATQVKPPKKPKKETKETSKTISKTKDRKKKPKQEQEKEEQEDMSLVGVKGVTKHKLYLTEKQKKSWKQAFGAAQFVYNRSLEYYLTHSKLPATKLKRQIRDYLVTKHATITQTGFTTKAGKVIDCSWLSHIPYDWKDRALSQFLTALKSIRTKIKNKLIPNESSIKWNYLSKWSKSKAIVVDTKFYHPNGSFFPSYLGKDSIRASPPLPKKINHAITLTFNWLGEFYAITPRSSSTTFPKKREIELSEGKICAIDPGVRTFGTIYDPLREVIVEWGSKDISRLYRLCVHKDKLQSGIQLIRNATKEKLKVIKEKQANYSLKKKKKKDRRKKAKDKKKEEKKVKAEKKKSQEWLELNSKINVLQAQIKEKRKLFKANPKIGWLEVKRLKNQRKKLRRERAKIVPIKKRVTPRVKNLIKANRRIGYYIDNLRRDFHYRYANWLCENYNVILLPDFKPGSMIKKGNRKISNKSVRQMLTWSPCGFRDRLFHLSSRYENCFVRLVSEAYTSKTCTFCGTLNYNLGSSSVFRCCSNSCGRVLSRDVNGCRNIFLRYLSSLNNCV